MSWVPQSLRTLPQLDLIEIPQTRCEPRKHHWRLSPSRQVIASSSTRTVSSTVYFIGILFLLILITLGVKPLSGESLICRGDCLLRSRFRSVVTHQPFEDRRCH